MDFVEIRASRNSTTGELPIIMRGFLDAPSGNTVMPSQGGPQEPRIMLTGQDFTTLLLKWQILYLFQQNEFTKSGGQHLKEYIANAAGYGLFANFKIPIFANSINAWIGTAFKHLVGTLMQGLKAHNYPSLPDFLSDFKYPAYPMNGLAVASFTGSYWNLLSYAASAPFGELFVRDEAAGPTLIGRMTPYKTIQGKTPRHGYAIPNSGDIHDIQSINVSRTDIDLLTYFLTWATDGQLFNMTMPTFLPGLSNGVLTSKSRLYGINPLVVDTPWVSIAQSDGTPAKNVTPVLQLAADLNSWLIATMADNELFWSGALTCHGDETLQVGTYRNADDGTHNREYYVSQVNHNFNYTGNNWTSTAQIVRGIDV